MFGREIAFDSPWYLLLLLVLPVLWVASYHSLSGLGRWRRLTALTLRTGVVVLLVLALAELQMVRRSDRITVIYLLDQSASIPVEQREAMREFVRESVREHRDDDDRSAVITFGREATIEYPPLDDDPPLVGVLESARMLRIDATNMEAALKLALATFPEDSAKRIVLVSDGNENVGDGRSVAQMMAEDAVGIDVVPVIFELRGEVAVEKVVLPADIRRGQPFDVRVVVNNMSQPTADNDGVVSGVLRLMRRQGNHVVPLADSAVELAPGKEIFTFEHVIEASDFYEYEAMFVPDDATADVMTQNNQATAFTHVRGKGQVLVIENYEELGEFEFLIEQLQEADLEVTRMATDQLFTSLADLQRYDTVILADVPRDTTVGDDLIGFSNRQIDMLVSNTHEMGSGLVMLGGPDSFGVGGWTGTALEEAMPVDFKINNAEVQAVGALAMIMHACEMPEGNRWQKLISEAALESLGPQDYCGVIEWNMRERWLWGPNNEGMQQVGPNRRTMLARLGRMVPGDMPDFDPGMQLAANEFARLSLPGNGQPAVKHMIIISDGDPTPPSQATINALINQGVTISTVAVGTHIMVGPNDPLPSMARQTGGKFYNVTNAQALPRIFQREARRVALPLVHEFPSPGVQPVVTDARHQVLQGIEGPMPNITGYVMTTLKENPLVEQVIISPQPATADTATILATWPYGFGRAAAFTTDGGNRWAHDWTGWGNYEKFFTQLVQWSMRPSGDTGQFTVATEVENGRVHIVVTALDEEGEFLNFLDFRGTAVDSQLAPHGIQLEQVASGRYEGYVDIDEAGSVFLTLLPGSGHAPIRTGVDIPYSPEYRVRTTNVAYLTSLAALEPAGGEPGQVAEGLLNPAGWETLLALNPFRPDLPRSASATDIWPLLVLLAACLFLADVFIRRVNVSFAWVPVYAGVARDFVLRRERAAEPDARMERLRSLKAEMTEEVDRQRASVRFEPEPDADIDTNATLGGDASRKKAPPPPPSSGGTAQPKQEEETYMDRLLKAKKQARGKQKPPDG